MTIRSAGLAAALLFSGAALAQEMELQIELMGPLGTRTSHKGDRVFGRVAQPDCFKGDNVEGTVKDVRSGGKLRGNSVLNFSFETLTHGGQSIPLNTQVKSFRNSQGQADVDEEGRVIRHGGGNTGKAVAGTAAGGLIGGIAGGLKGAAIGSAAGAAASIAVIEITADAPEIRFNPGAVVIVSAKTRGGPSLAEWSGAPASAPTTAPTTAAPAGGQPDFTALKDEFIPGARILLYDDFTDMSPDEAPPHWKVRGASLTLMAAGGIRQMVAEQNLEMTPMLSGFPANFTVETEVKFESYATATWHFYEKGSGDEALQVYAETRVGDNRLRIIARAMGEPLTDDEFPAPLDRPVKWAIWVQNGRLRVFLNGQRVVDANQLKLPALDHALLDTRPDHNQNAKIAYRLIRIAESTPDFSRSIQAAGRFVTYGIQFDTDSDRLKPESAGALQSIAFGLQSNPELKLRIEGHTDSTGNEAHNLDLSKRRAEAVRSVLVSEFQIDGARLTADGLGATKPVAANDTPQGRAQNRRVELVKQ
jgi:outer membrane protein OmpA-like peptidoglycan-associated protein